MHTCRQGTLLACRDIRVVVGEKLPPLLPKHGSCCAAAPAAAAAAAAAAPPKKVEQESSRLHAWVV